MKRTRNLFPKMISDENIRRAIYEVNKTHRWNLYPNKPNKTVLWCESTINERVEELRQIILDGYVESEGTEKQRYDNNAKKWRKIYEPKLYPDQYIHHILVQVLEPVMMKGMDKWCCGSIKDRGAHYGIKKIKKAMNTKDVRWCGEFDIYHFYESITPNMIINRFKHLIKDWRVLDLIERIVANGVKIGCYCSQWFANTLLQPLDQLLRQNISGIKCYIRYIDNFTILVEVKRDAKKARTLIKRWLKSIGLTLKDNWQYFKVTKRMPNALGYRFGIGFTLIRKHILLKIKRGIARFYAMRERGQRIPLKFAQGLLSRLGMLRHCNNYNIYHSIVPKKTQRKLKDIIRMYARKEHMVWSMYLEQYSAAA